MIFYTLSKKLSNQSLGYIYHSGSLLLIGLLMLVVGVVVVVVVVVVVAEEA